MYTPFLRGGGGGLGMVGGCCESLHINLQKGVWIGALIEPGFSDFEGGHIRNGVNNVDFMYNTFQVGDFITIP